MTYADGFSIRTPKANFENVADGLDGLLVSYQSTNTSSLINTTSTSLVDYTSGSITISNATGEIIIVHAQISCTNSGADTAVFMTIREDSTDLEEYGYNGPSKTSGDMGCISLTAVRAPTAGSHTYKIRWRAEASTAYSLKSRIWAVTLQNT